MNAIDLLIDQHCRLEASMEALVHADKSTARQRLLVELADTVSVHMASEERLFYPAVRDSHTEEWLLESLKSTCR